MKMTEEQERIFKNLRVLRLKDIDLSIVFAHNGPIIKGQHFNHLLDQFRHDTSIAHDFDNHVNSYVIVNHNYDILSFFSLRCGELFDTTDKDKMLIGSNAYKAFNDYSRGVVTKEIMESIMEASNMGLTPAECKEFYFKKQAYKDEMDKEPLDINRVRNVHSAIELKFFGTTDEGKEYWKSLGMPKNIRLGEAVFWMIIIPFIQQIRESVGCHFLYLFAADKDVDGSLVNYYKSTLHFDNSPAISVNKPQYDYKCIFLYKDIKDQINQRNQFILNFNPDPEEEII